MRRYKCSVCGYVYDEQTEGKRWSALPHDWTCPVCGAAKSEFEPMAEDKEAGAPQTPGRAIRAHRVFGYVFLAVYIILMWQMVPRLWTYQIEFPARTVAHIVLGMSVGAVLVLKICVVRFFRRLDASLVPLLGTWLAVSSVVLIGISVPAAFAEALATESYLGDENRARVEMLLGEMGWPEEQCSRLASPESLRAGQEVLRTRCIECHDLRTVLARPRTPESWHQTVRRMSDRTTLVSPLTEEQQLTVTAYLVAISPQLQRSAKKMREQQGAAAEAKEAAATVATKGSEAAAYDPSTAKRLFQTKCSQCHQTTLVEQAPPASEQAARELVARMVEEGLSATPDELMQIAQYLIETHAKPANQ